MNRTLSLLIAAALMTALMTGCAAYGDGFAGQPAASKGISSGAFYNDGASDDVRAVTEQRFDSAPSTKPVSDPQAPPTRKRLMTYSAALAVEVPRPDEAIERCAARVDELGGWIAGRDDNRVTYRVPAAEFAAFLDLLRGMGRVLSESMDATDVTDRHRDLHIRIENARRSRDRLLVLLEKAEDVADVLAIEKELQRLTEEIERAEALLAGLDERVAFSVVTVQFHAPADAPARGRRRPSPFGWINRVGAEQALRSF